MDVKSYIAERLFIARRRAGLKQNEVADKLGVSAVSLGKWENAVHEPSYENLWRLAQIYNVNICFFFEGLSEEEARHFSFASAHRLAMAA